MRHVAQNLTKQSIPAFFAALYLSTKFGYSKNVNVKFPENLTAMLLYRNKENCTMQDQGIVSDSCRENLKLCYVHSNEMSSIRRMSTSPQIIHKRKVIASLVANRSKITRHKLKNRNSLRFPHSALHAYFNIYFILRFLFKYRIF